MANSSILGGTRAPATPAGKDIVSLGPSDSSDSGSDVQGDAPGNAAADEDEGAEGALPIAHDSTGDAAGTGERASADARRPELDGDVLPDRIGQLPPGRKMDLDETEYAKPDELASDEDEDREGESP